jgi:hypothetical protein
MEVTESVKSDNHQRTRLTRVKVADSAVSPPIVSGIGTATKEAVEYVYPPKKNAQPPRQEDVDSPVVNQVIKIVASFFDSNPRRIIQFINIFRLKIYIGNNTGLFNAPPAGSKFKRIDLELLGKFVAVSLRYPLLIARLDEDPQFLEELQNLFINEAKAEENTAMHYWANKSRLKQLLLTNLPPQPTNEEKADFRKRFALINLDIEKLLQVSPPTDKAKSQDTNKSSAESKETTS